MTNDRIECTQNGSNLYRHTSHNAQSVRVTTKQSGVVTRAKSGTKPPVYRHSSQWHVNAAWMTGSVDRKVLHLVNDRQQAVAYTG